ncbi:MAG: hypothetical protein RLZZ502_758 [Pseudomonadota bacterium]|jgi:FkbM family methyltransferase
MIDYEQLLETKYTAFKLKHPCILDIGAHTGRHTLPFIRLLDTQFPLETISKKNVYAFEPLPHIRQTLQTNIAKQQSKVTCTVLPYALSNQNGETAFLHALEAPEESGLKARHFYNIETRLLEVTVERKKLDDLELPPIGLIKMDVEGAELWVLQGASETIKRDRPIVCFECGAGSYLGYHDSPESMFDFFTDLGYRIESVTGIAMCSSQQFREATHEQEFWDYIALPDTSQ